VRARLRLRARTVAADASDVEINLATWPAVDDQALPEAQRANFRARVCAVRLYLDGASGRDIRTNAGIGRGQVYRLITERCLAPHPDGQIYGWRGLLPHARIRPYTRTAPIAVNPWGGGAAGALQAVFRSAAGQGLEAEFRQQILGHRKTLESTRQPRAVLYRWFLNALRERGFEQRGEWPFNVAKQGYKAICRFIADVIAAAPLRTRSALLGGPEAQRKTRTGDGTRRPALRLFERVECDAHKLDARMVILVPSPHGGHEPRVIHRLWVVVLIEVASRAVLGYSLSLRRECSAEDVLRAIRCALTLWTPRDILFSNNAYAKGAGLPSYRAPRFVGACWEEFSVDGALANICNRVEAALQDVVGARIVKPQDPGSFSHRRSKDDRPFIEAFFRCLAAGGLHRLATTTGNSPDQKRGTDPEQTAKDTHFQLEFAQELLDVLIANYNATPHSGLGYRSPLDQLELLADQEDRPLPTADPIAVSKMVGVRKLCALLGGSRTGRRPHFHFANARYSAEWLCLRGDLLGKKLWLTIENEDDARFAAVSTQAGHFLGVVRASPPWHRTPHSLYVRQAIRSLERRRLLFLSSGCDAVEALLQYAEGSPGRRLPPHPAYLEARRILQQYAELVAGESMVTLARQALPSEVAADPTPAGPASPLCLPPMRKAQLW